VAAITDLEVPAESFALSETFDALPNATFEGERAVSHSGDVLPFVWAETADFERLESSFEDDPTVERASAVTDTDDERLYRMEWADEAGVASHALSGQSILDARATGGHWRLRVVFPDRDALSENAALTTDDGPRVEIRSIHGLDSRDRTRFGLTTGQHETLRTALEEGYYDVPRRNSLTELADYAGISHQALSERLRRGHRSLVEHTVGADPVDRADRADRSAEPRSPSEPTL
jgi:predicted DNA binding protein